MHSRNTLRGCPVGIDRPTADEADPQNVMENFVMEQSKQGIVIEIRNVYGTEKVYPVCEQAHAFADIAGTTTLTPDALDHIQKRLGYELILEQKSPLAAALGVK